MNKKFDTDFYEHIIIRNCLTNENYLATVVEHLTPEIFNDKDIKNIVTIITDYFQKRSKVPTATEIKSYLIYEDQKESFKKVINGFKDLEDVDEKELFENTEQFIRERSVFNTMLDVTNICSSADKAVDTSIILDKFEKVCSISLLNEKGHDYYVDIDKHCSDLETVDRCISTGWDWLDRKMGGGFLEEGKSLYVFAGETNVGKSIFLQNIAQNIADTNKSVLIISLEMSEKAYCKRISANLSKIPFNDLRLNTKELKEIVINHKLKLPSSRIVVKEFPPNTMTVPQITAFIKKLSQSGLNFDAIVIDYLNLLTGAGDNSYDRIKRIAESCRAMSYMFNCPIITATQLNRGGYGSDPGLDNISESIGTAATADVIIGLWQEEEDRELNVIKMSLMKNRYGPNFGTINMRINYPTLTLEEDNTLNADDNVVNTSEALKAFAGEIESENS